MTRNLTSPLLIQIGTRLVTWVPSEDPANPSTIASLGLRDGQRLVRSIRARLPQAGETRAEVIAACVAVGTSRGENVVVVSAKAGS